MTDVVQVDGWWWPAADRRARPVITRDVSGAVFDLLKHVQGRDCILQAGGNVGVYPLALADHFRSVVTAEPDPLNLECLRRNLRTRDALNRVDVHPGALGRESGLCAVVEVEPDNCGAHRIEPSAGAIPVLAIDDLDLWACDAIWLDIEGHELAALQGAVETLREFGPVVVFEDKGLSRAYGVERGEAGRWLESLGYERAGCIGHYDVIYRRPL